MRKSQSCARAPLRAEQTPARAAKKDEGGDSDLSMVKMRMTAADVAAQVACLQRLVGFRLANVYDLDAKTFVLKLSKSGGATATGESEKALLLIESGVRIHTTAYGTASCAAPPCGGASLRGWRVCVRGCAPSHGDRVSKGGCVPTDRATSS